jgi:hypothetical protein
MVPLRSLPAEAGRDLMFKPTSWRISFFGWLCGVLGVALVAMIDEVCWPSVFETSEASS